MPVFCIVTAYPTEKINELSAASGLNYTMTKPIFKEQLQDFLINSGLEDLLHF